MGLVVALSIGLKLGPKLFSHQPASLFGSRAGALASKNTSTNFRSLKGAFDVNHAFDVGRYKMGVWDESGEIGFSVAD